MLLDIRHTTEFRYERPVRESVMELIMQPQKSPKQRVVSFDLDISPAAQLFSYGDAFGNAVYHFDVPERHDRLLIEARSAVETTPAPPLPGALDNGEWDRLGSGYVQAEWFDYLQQHGFARTTPALTAFMAEQGLDRPRLQDPLTALRRLNRTLYDAFDYTKGVTDAESEIDVALAARKGVCQDFAHVMLAVCRAWGLPARYVSGYVYHRQGDQADRSDPDASHAWVEVFLPSTRWIGFDPTNAIETGERHVTVAVGRDYGDVPPTRGVYKGQAEHELRVGVRVGETSSAQAEPEFLRLSSPAFARGPRRRPGAVSSHQQQQ